MEKGPHETWPHPDPLHRATQRDFQFAEVQGREVGELDLFEIPPYPLIGVEFGGVRGQILEREPAGVVLSELLDGDGLVLVDVVPDQNDPPVHVTQQVPQKDQDLFGCDGSPAHQDIQLAPVADSGDRGELRPAVAVSHNRRLSYGRPGSDASRDETETTLVGEDQRRLQPAGFFLIRGQSCRSHRRTSTSSRSMARPVGLWYDQPHCRRSFGTWLTW